MKMKNEKWSMYTTPTTVSISSTENIKIAIVLIFYFSAITFHNKNT